MLKWTASAQRLNEMQLEQDPAEGRQRQQRRRQQRRHRRATIANKENVPDYRYTSTPLVVPALRLRNSPLVLAPLSDIRNVTPEAVAPTTATQRVQSVRYATTLPHFAEDYSPNGVLMPGQHLALRGLAPLDPFLGQPQRYMAATGMRETKRKLDADLVATMEEQPIPATKQTSASAPASTPSPVAAPSPAPVPRSTTPQPASTQMGDQTLDRLIDAILDSACKADASAKKKPRRCRSTFNLRRRTLVKQQLDADCGRAEVLSPSYAPGDDPASDLSFGTMPMMPLMPLTMTTPEPASPLVGIPHQVLVQLPTPKASVPHQKLAAIGDNTFCLETPVRSLKRSRVAAKEEAKESPLKRYKVDERNYFEVGLALPSSIYV
ncbi:hypothetical protein KR032_011631 [Drosophila birchii]|nr:hypothetical protein KR032_011631 [Drosophila birchii]